MCFFLNDTATPEIYALSLHDALPIYRLWKRQLPGRVAAQPLVAEDGILLAPLSGEECLVLSLRDGKKLNSINVGEDRSEEHTSELQSRQYLVCRLFLVKITCISS